MDEFRSVRIETPSLFWLGQLVRVISAVLLIPSLPIPLILLMNYDNPESTSSFTVFMMGWLGSLPIWLVAIILISTLGFVSGSSRSVLIACLAFLVWSSILFGGYAWYYFVLSG
jgi:hypothetical protein